MKGKTCTKCGYFKGFNDFYKDVYNTSGYKSQCKDCERKRRGAKKQIPIIKNEKGKECRKCGEFKSFVEFHKDKRTSDGRRSDCNICHNKSLKKYYEENKEEVLQRNAQYGDKNKEKIKKWKKQYYDENQEFITRRERKRWHKNADYNKKRNKQWRQTDSGKESSFKNRIKRRSYKHKTTFTPIERKKLLERDNWKCQLCGCKVHDRSIGNWNTPDKAHIDHIIPISKGGSSEIFNLQVLCRTCNLSKQDKVEKQLELILNTI